VTLTSCELDKLRARQTATSHLPLQAPLNDGLPPFRAQPEGRARNLGEAGSAQPEGRALHGGGTNARLLSGPRRNPSAGSNPALLR
jgi:hypothetical protein